MIALTFILMMFAGVLTAPPYTALYIIRPPEINYYEPLIKAVTYVESCNGKYTYNAKEQAVGWFSIRQCRVDHWNKLMGTSYKLDDFYDYDLSREMFLYFAKGKTFEKAARDWNGKWSLTEGYWQKVKKLI